MLVNLQFVGEPAGDRVAGEADHAAAAPLHLDDQRVIDLVDPLRQYFGAAAGAKGVGECRGQRREPGDIGEERGARGVLRERRAVRQHLAAILRQIGGQRYVHLALLVFGRTH